MKEKFNKISTANVNEMEKEQLETVEEIFESLRGNE